MIQSEIVPITKYLLDTDIISLCISSKNYTNVGKLPCKITIAAIYVNYNDKYTR